ncbi:hypothetical protein K4749_25925 [Streptomyces sp. TRM72054]|nr:hypothetical protein [Streptomyces sp. TRM72054]
MRSVKAALDPAGVLNPGVVLAGDTARSLFGCGPRL